MTDTRQSMQGRRLRGAGLDELEDGDYLVQQSAHGRVAWVRTPNGDGPMPLQGLTLTEHDDGTITVAEEIGGYPSNGKPGATWTLTRGMWGRRG